MAVSGRLQIFLWAQKHILHDMDICRWFFEGFTEIQTGRRGSTL